jgi:hypothetical protein
MYLMGVYLTGVHLMNVHLMGVHLMGVHLIDVYFMDVQDCRPLPTQPLGGTQLSMSETHSILEYRWDY